MTPLGPSPPSSECVHAGTRFTLALDFAGLDPIATGVQVRLQAAGGTTLLDVVIPVGTGWSANGSATKFSLKDNGKPSVNNGISKVQIQDRSKKAPGARARQGTVKPPSLRNGKT